MGTKLQVDSYSPTYCSMRNLNHNPETMTWTTFYGENHFSNVQQHYSSSLFRSPSDSLRGANKDSFKQTILKHESIFKNQVIELHRLYRVQKNLMNAIPNKEQYKPRLVCEASSSSSIFPKHGSFKDSELRPRKVRRAIDLELPGDVYIDLDEVEQQQASEEKLFPRNNGNTMCSALRGELGLQKPNVLADLNEPLQFEETSANPSINFLGFRRQDLLTADPGLVKNLPLTSNGDHWLSSVFKGDGNKETGRSIHQTGHPAKEIACFKTSEEVRASSSYSNGKVMLQSQLPCDLANSYDRCWGRQNSCLTKNSASLETSAYLNSTWLSKTPQSSVRSNHVNRNYNDKENSSLDLNPREDFNLNVAPDTEVERDDPLSVLPWLRPSNKTAKTLDHQNSIVSSSCDVGDSSSCKKISGKLPDMNVACDESEDFDYFTTNIIDLNSCVMEEEEEDDCVAVAAKAIIAMSSSYAASKDSTNTIIRLPEDALAWFVDIVCSSPDDIKMDCFEEMTLKLRECTTEEYYSRPPVFDFPSTGPVSRTRRRGKRQRDFQRDILPGLVSLSRNEVTEDIQTFGGLMKATGHASWRCGPRGNKWGRRRKAVVVDPPPPPPPPRLASWGKTTRRPRRHRSSPLLAPNLPESV